MEFLDAQIALKILIKSLQSRGFVLDYDNKPISNYTIAQITKAKSMLELPIYTYKWSIKNKKIKDYINCKSIVINLTQDYQGIWFQTSYSKRTGMAISIKNMPMIINNIDNEIKICKGRLKETYLNQKNVNAIKNRAKEIAKSLSTTRKIKYEWDRPKVETASNGAVSLKIILKDGKKNESASDCSVLTLRTTDNKTFKLTGCEIQSKRMSFSQVKYLCKAINKVTKIEPEG